MGKQEKQVSFAENMRSNGDAKVGGGRANAGAVPIAMGGATVVEGWPTTMMCGPITVWDVPLAVVGVVAEISAVGYGIYRHLKEKKRNKESR